MLVISKPSMQADVSNGTEVIDAAPFSVIAAEVIDAITESVRAMIFTNRPVCAAVFVISVAFVGS
jgi:hypothetical protein